ncbi:MAG: 16S rRNA (adenine(1518)-N(6)/adenine(1519)-N(6))-dimethyltransferase RsmA [Candidatus Thermoplasmatota archaeon]
MRQKNTVYLQHSFSKNLGQNFLIDENVIQRQIGYGNINKKDIVLEIGGGLGSLTKALSEKACKVITIEKDSRLIKYLVELNKDNLEIIHGDALKIDFPYFNKVVSNLPYSISSKITFKLLSYNFEVGVLMYQKEFANRIVASPRTKEYSRLTVNVYYKAEAKLIEYVPPDAFYPMPKVYSAIVLLKPRKKKPFKILDEKIFYSVVRRIFNKRRKKIKNALSISNEKVPYLNNRGEELTPEQIGELANAIAMLNQNNQIP